MLLFLITKEKKKKGKQVKKETETKLSNYERKERRPI